MNFISHRQVHREYAAGIHLADDGDSPTHRFHNVPGDREPEAGTVNLCRQHSGTSIKRLKNPRQFPRTNAYSAVRDAYSYLAT
jgi:hypothetical protein